VDVSGLISLETAGGLWAGLLFSEIAQGAHTMPRRRGKSQTAYPALSERHFGLETPESDGASIIRATRSNIVLARRKPQQRSGAGGQCRLATGAEAVVRTEVRVRYRE